VLLPVCCYQCAVASVLFTVLPSAERVCEKDKRVSESE